EQRGHFSPADWRELERLREAINTQPAVIAYRQAEADLAELCHQVNHVISHSLGLDFAANARRSCCG
ncbi:MAG: YlbF family regulator, partial [Chloroflexi bacterium]